MQGIQDNQSDNSLIIKILFAIKKNLFLILAIIFITTSLGLGYSYIKKPNYTANIRVNFSIGENTEATTTTINEMVKYIDTIIYFCGQPVVLDRANAYYVEWIENYQQKYYAQGKTIEDFYEDFEFPKQQGSFNNLYNKYEKPDSGQAGSGTLKDETFLTSGAISTQTAKTESTTIWVYTIGYTDANKQDAYEKAHILVLAYKHELYWDSDLGKQEQYFTNLDVNIENLGFDGINSNVSKIKILLIGFLIGAVIAFAVVYIKSALNNTVTNKDEYERLSGTQIIGTINYVKERDRDGK